MKSFEISVKTYNQVDFVKKIIFFFYYYYFTIVNYAPRIVQNFQKPIIDWNINTHLDNWIREHDALQIIFAFDTWRYKTSFEERMTFFKGKPFVLGV